MKNLSIELRWAFLFSVVTLVWMGMERLVGLHDKFIDYHLYLTNLFAIPAILMMVLGLKAKKQQFYKGQMSYKQGFISGTLLSVFIGVLTPFTQWITSYVITPEYFTNVIRRSVELKMYANVAEAEAQFNYANYALQGSISAVIMGIITTSIAMIFIKTKR